MTGDKPFRRRRLRRKKSSEADQGGTGPAKGVVTPAGRSALSPSPGEWYDERGRSASLEAAAAAVEAVAAQGGHEGAGPAQGAGRLDRTGPRTGGGRLRTVRRGVRKGGEGARTAIGHIADLIIESAPRVPVRDLATLREQFPGLGPEALADKLVTGASRASATVGAGIGAAAMMPVPPAMLTELTVEITGVAAVELKLVAELHEVYGLRPPGGPVQRSGVYLTSWTEERGIDASHLTTVDAALGGQMKRHLRQRVVKRLARDVPTLIPFLVGAAVGAVMNRRDTRRLAAKIRKDLRERQVPWDRLPQLPPLERARGPRERPGKEPED